MMNVLIGVPTRGTVSVGTVRFLWNAPAQAYFSTSAISVVHARRNIAAKFMKEAYSALLFLDDDISPPADVLARLEEANRPIVSANYPTYIDGRIRSCAYKKVDNNWFASSFAETGVGEVDAVGLGCCLIKREVFVEIGADFSIEYFGGDIVMGEDIGFCERAKSAGFPIYCNFDCICDHYKPVSLKAVWDKYCV